MSLIIATGSNLGDSKNNLKIALEELKKNFDFISESRIYYSKAVDYTKQPDFFNQVLEFKLPSLTPDDVMTKLLEIEKKLGRTRDISRGPRTIDIDILFWGTDSIQTNIVTIPHPRWNERSFVVLPLRELPFFQTIEKCFTIPTTFNVEAFPI